MVTRSLLRRRRRYFFGLRVKSFLALSAIFLAGNNAYAFQSVPSLEAILGAAYNCPIDATIEIKCGATNEVRTEYKILFEIWLSADEKQISNSCTCPAYPRTHYYTYALQPHLFDDPWSIAEPVFDTLAKCNAYLGDRNARIDPKQTPAVIAKAMWVAYKPESSRTNPDGSLSYFPSIRRAPACGSLSLDLGNGRTEVSPDISLPASAYEDAQDVNQSTYWNLDAEADTAVEIEAPLYPLD